MRRFLGAFLSSLFLIQWGQASTIQNCIDTFEISYVPYCQSQYSYVPGLQIKIVQDPTQFEFNGSTRTLLWIVCSAPSANGPGYDTLYTWSCMANSPGRAGPPPPPPPKEPVCKKGSIIRVEEGSVGEQVELVGTPFFLSYTSERSLGNQKVYKMPFMTSMSNANTSTYLGSNFDINFANGRQEIYAMSADESRVFTWDGKDSSGDYTEAPARIEVEYRDNYQDENSTYSVTNVYSLGTWNTIKLGLGGWNINAHHLYDASGLKLYRGDGSIVSAIWHVVDGNHRVVSPDGSEVYYFDMKGKHLTTNSARTNAVIYTFNYLSNGYLSSIVDAYGNTISVIRNGSGEVTGIQGPYGHLTSLSLDSNGRLASIQNPKGETYSMTYYSNGLLHTFQKPRGQVSTMTYDAEGNLTLDSSSAGDFTSISTSQTSVIDRTFTTSDINGVSSTIYLNIGNGTAARSQVERSGEIKSMSFDPNIGLSTSDPFGAKNITYENDPRFGPFLKNIKTFSYNSFGTNPFIANLTYSVVNTASTPTPFNYDSIQTTFNINGKVGTSTFVRSTGIETFQSPVGRFSSWTTDSYDRITNFQFANFTANQFSYDSLGRLQYITQGSRQTEIIYNASGDISGVKNPLNQTTSFTYDLAGNVQSVTLPDLRTINYTYDSNGNIATITPSGTNAHAFTFNPFDLPEYYTPPTVPTSTPATHYTYDNVRRVTQITKPDLSTVNFTYDPTNGLLTSIMASGDTTSFTLNPIGKVTNTISQDNINTTQNFAGNYLLSTWSVAQGSSVYIGRVDYVYNADYLPTKITLTDVNAATLDVNYSYDNDGILNSVGAMGMSLDLTTGLKTKTVLNKIQEVYSYDSSYGEPLSFTAKYVPNASTSTPLFVESYIRDSLGRVTIKNEIVGTTTNQFVYTYDTSGRLTDVSKNSVAYSHYNFSDNNNLTSGTVGGIAFTATYDAQDRILTYNTTTSTSFTHTANGEMKSKTVGSITTNYTWNGFGMLKTAKVGTGATITYLYDGLNRLVGRKSGATVQKYWLYQDQLRIAAELNASGAITKKFIYGTKVNVPDYMISGSTTYKIISDYLGSVRMVVNASNGAIAQKIEYNELGAVISDTSPGFQPFYFAGGLYDTTTKLLHFGARYYDPSIGRWISKDPIGFEGGDTNLYGYVVNDPVNWIDPSGEILMAPIIIGGAISGGLELGGQLLNNGGNIDCVDWKSVGTQAAIGGALGGIGQLLAKTKLIGTTIQNLLSGTRFGAGGAANQGLVRIGLGTAGKGIVAPVSGGTRSVIRIGVGNSHIDLLDLGPKIYR